MTPEEFKNYYTFPLLVDSYGYNKVWDSKHRNAFDFAMKFVYKEPVVNISDEDKKKFIQIINGDDVKLKKFFDFTLDKGTIRLNGMPFIIIRGWGMLTGVGAYNLPPDKAATIQDQFANYVLDKLKNCIQVS